MAYDKVIDSAVLNANLKAVADAIREKGGTSDNLAFPTGFAEAIAAIEAGGGAPIYIGAVTPAADVVALPITHGLNLPVDRLSFIIYAADGNRPTNYIHAMFQTANQDVRFGSVRCTWWSTYAPHNTPSDNTQISLNEITVNNRNTAYTFQGGRTHAVIVWDGLWQL